MKVLILMLVSLISGSAFAQQVPMTLGALERVGFIAGEVISATRACPDGVTCFVDGTNLTVRFTLRCLDGFGEDALRKTEDGVVIGMIGLFNAESKNARCFAPNTKDISYLLVDTYPPFQVHFMGKSAKESVSVPDFTSP